MVFKGVPLEVRGVPAGYFNLEVHVVDGAEFILEVEAVKVNICNVISLVAEVEEALDIEMEAVSKV